MNSKYNPKKLFIKIYNYNDWYEYEESSDKKESSDKEKSDMPPLDGDEKEVKEKKALKILTSNKLLARIPILLA